MGEFSKTVKKKLKKKNFVCVSLGLKKPGDFIVSEGHGYPLVFFKFIGCLEFSPLPSLFL
jgi:hypothetical protein